LQGFKGVVGGGGWGRKKRSFFLPDYLDLKRAAELLEKKVQFTNEGLEELRKLKAGMNSGRKQDADR
jgi:hypothetical protein